MDVCLLDGNDDQIQEVVDLGIVPNILKFLKYFLIFFFIFCEFLTNLYFY